MPLAQQPQRLAQLPRIPLIRMVRSVRRLGDADGEMADQQPIPPADGDEEGVHADEVPGGREARGRPVDEGEVGVGVEDGGGFGVELVVGAEEGGVDGEVLGGRGVGVLPTVVDARGCRADLAGDEQGQGVDPVADFGGKGGEEEGHGCW